jgi:hypothetical protein
MVGSCLRPSRIPSKQAGAIDICLGIAQVSEELASIADEIGPGLTQRP